MTKYVIIDPDSHGANFYDSRQAAVATFDYMISLGDLNENIILMELKMPKRSGAPKAKIIGVRSQGYVIGTWPPKKGKKK